MLYKSAQEVTPVLEFKIKLRDANISTRYNSFPYKYLDNPHSFRIQRFKRSRSGFPVNERQIQPLFTLLVWPSLNFNEAKTQKGSQGIDGLLGNQLLNSSGPSLKSRLLEVISSTRLVWLPKLR